MDGRQPGLFEPSRLHESYKGTWWIECMARGRAVVVDPIEAAAWLLVNGHALPDDLAKFEQELEG
jgi:hypothetical protein